MTEHPTIRAAVRWLVPIVLIAIVPFMLQGGPRAAAWPVYNASWNLGHLVFYALLTVFLYQHVAWLRRPPGWVQLVVLSLVVLVIGVVVEWLQNGVQQAMDWHDIWRNQLGALVAWAAVAPQRPLRGVLIVVGVMGVLWELGLVGQVVIEQRQIAGQLPVLSALEAPADAERWSGDVSFTQETAAVGRGCLRVDLGTTKYSGTGLSSLPRDWRGYETLVFWLHNPVDDRLPLTLRIHDREHDHRYEDRFNTRVFAEPGWQRIAISLDEVRQAPQGREMDLGHVLSLGLFATELPAPRVIHLDDVHLE